MFFVRLSVFAVFSLLLACATPQRVARAPDFERPIPQPVAADELPAIELNFSEDGFAYLDGKTGLALQQADVFRLARESQIILVGERHDDENDHLVQADIIRAVGQGENVLHVGFEMVERTNGSALDRFSRAEIDVDGLYAALSWEETWGFDAELYRPVWDAVRAVKARPVGINAPRTLVRAVARQGLAALSVDDKAQLPEMDLGDQVHRELVQGAFQMHHHAAVSEDGFERFYAAQVLWDETMAQELVGALDAGATHVVGLAGNGHVEGYRGIPQRILRRKPNVRLLTIVPLHLADDANPNEGAREAVAERLGDILVIRAPRSVLSL